MEVLLLVSGSVTTTSKSLPAGARVTLLGGPRAARRDREEITFIHLMSRCFTCSDTCEAVLKHHVTVY